MNAQNVKLLGWPATIGLILLTGCFAVASAVAGYEGFKQVAVEWATDAIHDSTEMTAYVEGADYESEQEAEPTVAEHPTMPAGYTVSWLAKSRNFHYCSRAGLYPHHFPPE